MNDIQKTIELFLNKYFPNDSGLVYIVAFSGGFDSMCLLDVLKKIKPENKIVAIHLNHNWRGEESDREEENGRTFCHNIGVDFYSEKLSDNIPHTETAARDARYEFFEKCAKQFNSKIVFTAHNKNDNAETLIYRICKGTGISGLRGISRHRDIFYRPLLTVARSDIENYCKFNNLTPNVDSSNKNTEYKRNYIREKILPALAVVNPNIVDTINTLSAVAEEEAEIVGEYLKIILNKIKIGEKIKTNEFLNLSEPVKKRIIYNIFINYNLDYSREKILGIYDFIHENSNSKSGKTCSLSTDLWIFTSSEYIEIINKKSEFIPEIKINKVGIYDWGGYVFEISEFCEKITKFPEDKENYAYVNLSDFPINFTLRQRHDGDIIQPLGLLGCQKLKKYLNEKKIPNHEKDNLMFLTSGKEILWAIGLGISDKIKVTEKSTHIIKFYKK